MPTDFRHISPSLGASLSPQMKQVGVFHFYTLLCVLMMAGQDCYSQSTARNSSVSGRKGPVQVQSLTDSTSSWDGERYESYPVGSPKITILKITIAPHTALRWHTHPMPSAGYVLSGDLTIEKPDGRTIHVSAGQAVTETVSTLHRGVTGDSETVLIVFYAGTSGLPLSQEGTLKNAPTAK